MQLNLMNYPEETNVDSNDTRLQRFDNSSWPRYRLFLGDAFRHLSLTVRAPICQHSKYCPVKCFKSVSSSWLAWVCCMFVSRFYDGHHHQKSTSSACFFTTQCTSKLLFLACLAASHRQACLQLTACTASTTGWFVLPHHLKQRDISSKRKICPHSSIGFKESPLNKRGH